MLPFVEPELISPDVGFHANLLRRVAVDKTPSFPSINISFSLSWWRAHVYWDQCQFVTCQEPTRDLHALRRRPWIHAPSLEPGRGTWRMKRAARYHNQSRIEWTPLVNLQNLFTKALILMVIFRLKALCSIVQFSFLISFFMNEATNSNQYTAPLTLASIHQYTLLAHCSESFVPLLVF